MTLIDDQSRVDGQKREEQRLRDEVSRIADLVAIRAQQESSDPTTVVCALLLAGAAVAKATGCTWAGLRSQLQNFWLSMGMPVDDGAIVDVVTPEQFDILVKKGRG